MHGFAVSILWKGDLSGVRGGSGPKGYTSVCVHPCTGSHKSLKGGEVRNTCWDFVRTVVTPPASSGMLPHHSVKPYPGIHDWPPFSAG